MFALWAAQGVGSIAQPGDARTRRLREGVGQAQHATVQRPVRCCRCRAQLAAEEVETRTPPAGSGSVTAAAIVTPVVPQVGGVAIVRVSGDHAVDVVRRVFRPGRVASRPKAWAVESHRAVYGHVYDVDGSVVDEVLVLAMLKPRSYTAEDVVEVHCHGGSICVQRVLQLCLRSGAQLAEPGEFTLRAFLNGRLDLLQAEAVNAIIQARTVEAADSALASAPRWMPPRSRAWRSSRSWRLASTLMTKCPPLTWAP
jgi:hypothetical protein